MIKMVFDSQKDLQALKMTLGNISFANDTGVIMYFDNDNICVYPASSSKSQTANIEIPIRQLASEYEIDTSTSVGVIDIQSLLQCFNAFGDGIVIEFDDEKFILTDMSGTSKLKYFASMPDNIIDCKGIDFRQKFSDSFVDFTLDVGQINRILKAFSVLGQEFINIKGTADSNTITLTITNKGDRSNSFEFELDTDTTVSGDFDYLFSKDHLLAYFGYSKYHTHPDFKFSIIGPMLACDIDTEDFSVSYFVSRKS